MEISIIGSGLVGQTTGIGLCLHGHDVVFYDIDEKKLEMLRRRGHRTGTLEEAVESSAVHMICVPTPTVKGKFDGTYVETAVTKLAQALVKKNEYQVVVVRSTVLPFTMRNKVIPLLRRHSSLKLGEHYGVCHNPEFLRSKYPLCDFLNPKLIVIGELDKHSGDPLEKLYSSLDAPIFRTKFEESEIIKYAANLFNATKVSFFNEIYLTCGELGIEQNILPKAIALAAIGLTIPNWGTQGGYPFGGSCLPKDLKAFINFVEERFGHNPPLLRSVLKVNKKIARVWRKNDAVNCGANV